MSIINFKMVILFAYGNGAITLFDYLNKKYPTNNDNDLHQICIKRKLHSNNAIWHEFSEQHQHHIQRPISTFLVHFGWVHVHCTVHTPSIIAGTLCLTT